MSNYISSQIHEKRALDRWENEGGGIHAEEARASQADPAGRRSVRAADRSFVERRGRDFAERLNG